MGYATDPLLRQAGAKMTVLTNALHCKLRAASVPSCHMSGFHSRHRPDQIVISASERLEIFHHGAAGSIIEFDMLTGTPLMGASCYFPCIMQCPRCRGWRRGEKDKNFQ